MRSRRLCHWVIEAADGARCCQVEGVFDVERPDGTRMTVCGIHRRTVERLGLGSVVGRWGRSRKEVWKSL